MRGERGPLFSERPFPEKLAVAAEGHRRRTSPERIDVAGFGIRRRGRPSDAVRWHVALEDVEFVFPDDLPGVGVEGHDAFLEVGPLAGRVLDVDAIAHDDRRRAPPGTGRATGSSRR